MSHVILVNMQDEPVGVMGKMEAHEKGILHRAFSIFIFNKKGEMLLQQRAENKYHSGGLWTNTCCSHPRPGEETIDAAHKRLGEEMGFQTPLKKAFSFIYKTGFDNGLTEHEFDHVFIGLYDDQINPDKEEVKDHCYMALAGIRQQIELSPQNFTSWFKIAFPKMDEYLAAHNISSK